MNHQVTAADWVEVIAVKSSLPASTVQETLDRYGIEPQSTLPRRKHLRIRSVRLQGVKEGTAENGPFDSTFRFGYRPLKPRGGGRVTSRTIHDQNGDLIRKGT